MSALNLADVVEVTGGTFLGSKATVRFRRVWTDSRTCRRGDLFVALQGERFDGHVFLEEAFQRGAAGALVDLNRVPRELLSVSPPYPLLTVSDPLEAYQDLAAHHRRQFPIPLVAITGSNGKTTTKEMVASILGERWSLLKSDRNFNNRIGVPQTLFRLTSRHGVAVLEMGVDRVAQTARLCDLAAPTIGVITNTGPDHLEWFGNLEAGIRAKGELLEYLPGDGVAVLNREDEGTSAIIGRARARVVTFGLDARADVWGGDVLADWRGSSFRLHLPGWKRGRRMALRAHGTHNLKNALAAATVGWVMGLTGEEIARGLARFRPVAMRSHVSRWQGFTLVNDCYNANPDSMKAAVDLLEELRRTTARRSVRTIAVLGDMLELGGEGPRFHRELGGYAAKQGLSFLITCGPLASIVAEGAEAAGMSPADIALAADAREAGLHLAAVAKPGDLILLKASRGVRLEGALEVLHRTVTPGKAR